MDFDDVSFECACGCKHNVREWIKRSLDEGLGLLDDRYTIDRFLSVGTPSARFVGVMCCECGRDYTVEAYNGAMSVILDGEIVYGTVYRRNA